MNKLMNNYQGVDNLLTKKDDHTPYADTPAIGIYVFPNVSSCETNKRAQIDLFLPGYLHSQSSGL